MPDSDRVRIDKWLWAARFFKTRSLAAAAVAGGKVHLNGARIKPARAVAIDDELHVRRGEQAFTVIVTGLSARRGPASEARTLYEETAQSIAARAARREQARLTNHHAPHPQRRPDKKARRDLIAFRERHRGR